MKLSKYHFYTIGIVWLAWFSYMFWSAQFYLFVENWFVSVIMVFGSFIAGASSEGGGAIAFPALTLLYDVHPFIARNFSLAIQSVGMTAATFVIYKLKITVEKKVILFVSLGGIIGIILGTIFIAPFIPAVPTKIFFVSLWLAFGLALYFINLDKERKTHDSIVDFKTKDKYRLSVVGVLGGILSGIFGNGIDIFTFSVLTLYYKINERVATTTSIVLMAVSSVVGFLFHFVVLKDFQEVSFNYWLVAIPVVVVFAPLGAIFISGKSREFIFKLLFIIIIVQFIGAFIILRPDFLLSFWSLIVFGLGSLFFWRLSLVNNYKR